MVAEEELSKQEVKSRIDNNELDLSLCGISKVPVKSLLPFTKVVVLDLSCNRINTLPDGFASLTHLVHIDLSKNSLTELPKDFGNLVKLKKLDLLNNNILELPLSFSNLTNLLWLDLKGNPIQESLPDVVGDCLKPAECQRCAVDVVAHYKSIVLQTEENERKFKKKEEARLIKEERKHETLRKKKREERRNKQKLAAEEKLLSTSKEENASEKKLNTIADKDNSSCSQGSLSTIFLLLLVFLGAGMAVLVKFSFDVDKISESCNQLFNSARIYLNSLKN